MPPGRAGSLESLRRLNRLRVIRALRDEGQISRADIARRTGLDLSRAFIAGNRYITATTDGGESAA